VLAGLDQDLQHAARERGKRRTVRFRPDETARQPQQQGLLAFTASVANEDTWVLPREDDLAVFHRGLAMSGFASPSPHAETAAAITVMAASSASAVAQNPCPPHLVSAPRHPTCFSVQTADPGLPGGERLDDRSRYRRVNLDRAQRARASSRSMTPIARSCSELRRVRGLFASTSSDSS